MGRVVKRFKKHDISSQDASFRAEGRLSLLKQKKALRALLLRALPFGIALTLVVIGGIALFREASHFSIHEIKQALWMLPPSALFKAAAATFLAYFLLSFYDYFGAWYARDPQPWLKSALAAFCSYVFAHNLGCTAISGAAVRYRLYRVWGMSVADIARMVVFCTWACSLGMLFLVGIALLAQPNSLPIPWITVSIAIPLGVLCLLVVFIYFVLSFRNRKLKIRNWELEMPNPLFALSQLLVSTLDLGVTALILWCVLGNLHSSTLPPLTFLGFVGLYLMAYLAGLLSSVPGGVGVFDAFLLTLLLPWFSAPQILGGLVIFRSFYYLIPLLLAGILFAGHEVFLKFFKKDQEDFLAQDGIHFADGDFTTQVGAFVQMIFGLGFSAYALLGLPGKESISLLDIVLFFIGAFITGLAFSLGQKVFAAWRASIILLLGLLPVLFFLQVDWIISLSEIIVLVIILPFRRYYYREAHMVAFPNLPGGVASFLVVIGILSGTAWTALERRSGEILWLSKDITSIALALAALICVFAILFAFRRTRIHLSTWPDEEKKADYQIGSFVPDGFLVESSGRAWSPCLHLDSKWDHRILLVLGGPYGDQKYFSSVVWRMRDLAIQEGSALGWLMKQDSNWEMGKRILKNLGLEPILWEDGRVFYISPSQISSLLHFLNEEGYSKGEIKRVEISAKE
ncbi:lysylphosphatidylglycerol synthetase family protein [Acetobacteraceae bacterium]|nr:lysylphosphatidylglycerol synthetase family protein [Acetobacteraceae bacterium]